MHTIDSVKKIPKQNARRVVGPRIMVRNIKRKVAPQATAGISLWWAAERQTVAAAMVLLLLLAFTTGLWAAESTQKSDANQITPIIVELPSKPIPLATVTPDSLEQRQVSNDVLFSTPIGQLQEYLSSLSQEATSTASSTEELLQIRTDQIKQYLTDMRSPLLPEAGVIAQQPHWKLILAISFAESTLGKKCLANNCSGIGGSNIKSYDSIKSWITDFNGLLERRYKDKTLEEMCGVYVQPCNPNWLLATKRVLQDLQDRNIE